MHDVTLPCQMRVPLYRAMRHRQMESSVSKDVCVASKRTMNNLPATPTCAKGYGPKLNTLLSGSLSDSAHLFPCVLNKPDVADAGLIEGEIPVDRLLQHHGTVLDLWHQFGEAGRRCI